MNTLRRLSSGSKWFIGLTAAYALLVFLLPVNHSAETVYHLSDAEYRVILFLIILPVVAVWLVALYSYRSVVNYAREVKSSLEGPGFSHIAHGLKWAAWGLLVPGILSSILNSLALAHPKLVAPNTILLNYIYVIIALLTFSYINQGAHAFTSQSKIRLSERYVKLLFLILAIFSVLFCALIADNMHGTGWVNTYNAYYMPNWLIWASIVMPYIYAWSLGITAACQLILVAVNTRGIIYRRALQMLASGLIVVIVSLCALQYFRTIIPRSGHFAVGPIVIAAYAILGTYVAGSILVAFGAKRLKKIEDI